VKNIQPTTQIKSTPKDVFLHLLHIVTFYISVVSLTSLLIQYIDIMFPNPLNFDLSGVLNLILWFTSILVIAFPFYIGTSLLMARDLSANPAKTELKVRKWFIYFTLFLAALTVLIDLILLVYNFLSGELTASFFLKTLIVLVVAGAAFGYYLWDLKKKADENASSTRKMIAWGVTVAVLLSIIGGFFLVGSPATQRARKFDDRRIQDLSAIKDQIVFTYWTQKGKLPEKFGDLDDKISGFIIPNDPETMAPYEYNVTDQFSFELCANFKTKSLVRGATPATPAMYRGSQFEQNWTHNAERTCFKRTIDPELYKQQIGNIPAAKQPLPLQK